MKDYFRNLVFQQSNSVKKITAILHEALDVSCFTYQKISSSGDYQVLVDRPDWAEFYIEQDCYQSDSFLRHPDFFQTGKVFLPYLSRPSHLQATFESLNIGDILVFIQKSSDAVELFAFSAKFKSLEGSRKLFNEESLMQKFMAYFKQETRLLLAQQEPYSLPSVRGDAFLQGEDLSPSMSVSQRLSFLSGIDDSLPYEEIEKLSRREKQCVDYLGRGNSLPAIAKYLELSPRTVEHYLENVKNKLGVYTRQELLQMSQSLSEIDFFLE